MYGAEIADFARRLPSWDSTEMRGIANKLTPELARETGSARVRAPFCPKLSFG